MAQDRIDGENVGEALAGNSAMQDQIRALQKQVAALQARLGTAPTEDSRLPNDERNGRRDLLKAAGAAALGATFAGLAVGASPAGAANGDPMTVGGTMTGTSLTTLNVTGANAFFVTTDNGQAVLGTNTDSGNPPNPLRAGVTGSSEFRGVGVSGSSNQGYGLVGVGGLAPLRLSPAASAGAPTTGAHLLGELYVDSVGVFYRCTVAGTPGTWVPQYSVVPLSAPVRVLNTTNGTGGLTGPFSPNGATHTTAVLTGGGTGIPANAVGVVANLAISGNGAILNGDGFLTLFPAGTANPGTASLNAGGGAFATSNGVTIAIGTGANAGQLSFSWQGGGSPLSCQVFLDVTAFIL